MSLFRRFLPRPRADRAAVRPLYDAIVAAARRPAWYAEGGVPDTLDGRFDMLALVLALVLVRLEREGAAGQRPSVLLTETFIDDMDGQLRQMGIGDIIVGKHVGKMMSALGGRLGAYREALASDGGQAIEGALVRNLYRGEAPAPAQLEEVVAGVRRLQAEVADTPLDTLIAGRLAR